MSAENVTPQRIGGRVTATKSTSAVSPEFREPTVQTPNIPRTQVTICGAPKAIAIPNMAAIHQPHEIRFAIAMAPRTITKMMAMGVSQERMLLSREVAPVRKGDAWAYADWEISRHAPSIASRAMNPSRRTMELSYMDVLRSSWNHSSMFLGGKHSRVIQRFFIGSGANHKTPEANSCEKQDPSLYFASAPRPGFADSLPLHNSSL